MTFYEKLDNIWSRNNSLVCVGLDPDLAKLPTCLKQEEKPIFSFNKAIIDATADLVCAYKPQIAYYAAQDAEDQLLATIQHIQTNYPHIPIILDSKRGDIGSTATMYAREAFERYKADSVTANPYMGGDTLEPFLEYEDKGTFVLCRTSNPGSGDFQNLPCGDQKVYETVATKAVQEWNKKENIGLVVGATYPAELGTIRKIVGEIPLLVPGIGAQGGDIEAAVSNGRSSNGTGMLINSSRGIIYASNGEDFADAARNATADLKTAINRYRE